MEIVSCSTTKPVAEMIRSYFPLGKNTGVLEPTGENFTIPSLFTGNVVEFPDVRFL